MCNFRPEYYCIPSIAELDDMVDENDDVIVGDFVVGREGFGMVKFFGEFNVARMNLDEIGKLLFCLDIIYFLLPEVCYKLVLMVN